jgi:hypothetical protein
MERAGSGKCGNFQGVKWNRSGRVSGGAAAEGDAGGQAARGHTDGERAGGEKAGGGRGRGALGRGARSWDEALAGLY